ncbi:MAG: hypothetical protein FWF63_00430 [Fibromonadales bacterium]|nr:hypothetical protein [Fibromonadales bacterium]
MTGFSGFAKGITPAETNSLIGEPVFSLDDLKNGFKQSVWENMDKVLKLKQVPKIVKDNYTRAKIPFIPKDIKIMPMPKTENLEKEYLEELNKKKIMF